MPSSSRFMRFSASAAPPAQAVFAWARKAARVCCHLTRSAFLATGPRAPNHDVEIEIQHAFHCLIPFNDAATGGVIDERRATIHEEVAGVQHAF